MLCDQVDEPIQHDAGGCLVAHGLDEGIANCNLRCLAAQSILNIILFNRRVSANDEQFIIIMTLSITICHLSLIQGRKSQAKHTRRATEKGQ